MMYTRRKAITIGGTVILAPSFVGVASGATDSGEIELTTTATIPTDTSIDIRINEDLGGTGERDNTQQESIPDGTDEITEYAALSGGEGDGNIYWLEITLQTSDDEVTPELESVEITLPEESTQSSEPTPVSSSPDTIDQIWDNYFFFVTLIIMGISAIGLGSKSLAIAAVAGYSAFAYYAIQTGTQLFENILIVTLVMVFVGFAFKFWRLEGMGE